MGMEAADLAALSGVRLFQVYQKYQENAIIFVMGEAVDDIQCILPHTEKEKKDNKEVKEAFDAHLQENKCI